MISFFLAVLSGERTPRRGVPIFFILFSLLLTQPCSAHFLNMTRAELAVDPSTGTLSLSMRVDFTRMLGDPVIYYELTQQSEEASAEARQKLVDALSKDLTVMVDGEPLALSLEQFGFPEMPLEKFTETWAAPMSELVFAAPLPEGAHVIDVKTNAWLRIEFPFVLTLMEVDSERRPVTRWLEPGQSSPDFAYSYTPSVTVAVAPEPDLESEEGWFSILRRYLVLGYLHILPKGLDHILFILGLFFLSHRWKPLLQQVSLFTLAHTLTLGLTVIGYIPYAPGIVEPLIALTIAYVGLENLFMRRLHWSRLIVVFVFGLIHGMGFAGMLQQIGLPGGELLLALISFNVGVEIGQVTVIVGAWLLLWKSFNWSYYRWVIQIPASLAISVIAAFWFFERIA